MFRNPKRAFVWSPFEFVRLEGSAKKPLFIILLPSMRSSLFILYLLFVNTEPYTQQLIICIKHTVHGVDFLIKLFTFSLLGSNFNFIQKNISCIKRQRSFVHNDFVLCIIPQSFHKINYFLLIYLHNLPTIDKAVYPL